MFDEIKMKGNNFGGFFVCVPSVSKDDRLKTICEALKPSALVDVNDDNRQIRRNPDCPLPEKDAEERTIYLKGFHRTETTLDDLLGKSLKKSDSLRCKIC